MSTAQESTYAGSSPELITVRLSSEHDGPNQSGPSHPRSKLKNIHESLEILSNTSRRENIDNDPDAIALVTELDGLPLALSAAGAYLVDVTTSFADDLRLYKASWSKL
ncbi:hypothetical protein LTR93_012389 [Exophiala xenobiotica]|nr:hypothetical protein LTR93_012389 [Exophiala xenobiotica]